MPVLGCRRETIAEEDGLSRTLSRGIVVVIFETALGSSILVGSDG